MLTVFKQQEVICILAVKIEVEFDINKNEMKNEQNFMINKLMTCKMLNFV